ncbi:TPA: hypothetical protein ACHF2V_002190 [Citrobacter farmeri]|uniref:Uncharacterized protein n=2 Tax=Enterobacteriaceae TaxID=543 RepID=A0A607IGS0_SALET|nr:MULTISPECIES: hypothetical protein [Enterobacter cloacae complex]ECU8980855.1 hypothetical protein [Salmonella enterica subsp. enterica serovar Sandiego]EFA4814003.1 hypothetical protein [Escherichia coli]EMB4683343.1 hypothetical protein [Klebsiella pneumoniae]HCI6144162.1 hypothetical protein [Klebsiella variicola subsp. variicola]EFB9390351.1 hypothetical protein [Escherichia coli]
MGRKISAFLKIIGVTGSLCGIIATAFAIYAHYNPTSPSTQRYDSIVGSWLSDYSYTVKGNTVRVNGKTTFFSNGKYNFHGSISIDSYAPGDHIFIDYLSDGAGDWQLYDNELITSLNSLKTKPMKLVLNNKDLDPLKIEVINNKKLPTIEESMADGKNQAYKVIQTTKSQLTLEVINEIGNNFKFNMHKAN